MSLREARSLRDAGRNGEALAAYAALLERSTDPGLVAEAAEVALRVEAPLAEALARSALRHAPTLAIARHHLGEALAAQGRFAEARAELRAATSADGRLADLRLPGAKPWTAPAVARPCPSCGTPGGTPVFVGNSTRVQTVFGKLDPVKVWLRCGCCELVFTETAPTEEQLAAYYAAQRGGAGGLSAPDGRAVAHESLTWEPVLDRLEAATGGPGTLLEVGSAWGVFLAVAGWRGWKVEGLELSADAAEFARSTFGLEVTAASVPEELPDATYDAVVLWEVLEHFVDPDAALAALARCVRPGGVLALSTPDLDHPAHRAAGVADPMWSVPGHLVWYDRRSLDAALNRAGFERIDRWFSARHVGSSGVLARKR